MIRRLYDAFFADDAALSTRLTEAVDPALGAFALTY
jgi:hypothetical protein